MENEADSTLPLAFSSDTPPAAATPAEAVAAAPASPAASSGAAEAYGFAALTPAEARVAGCLIEKQITTPEYYPLTLNALVAACNQKNNRYPVVEFDERTVVKTLDTLREKKLMWLMTTAGGRVPKYAHQLAERLLVKQPGEMAVLCELLLRGPQTPGELRQRAERMHKFTGVEEAQEVLDDLMMRPVPLVARLPRLPGHKESRYMHLLAGPPDATAPASLAPAPEAARLAVQAENARLAALETEVKALRQEITDLKAIFEQFKAQF